MQLNFKRIAIVNRGEPAIRLIRTIRDLNLEQDCQLKTIALFTEPDRRNTYVREADEAYCLGPASWFDPGDGQQKNAYLNYARLREALLATRAEAVWVGWGFVAEHAAFVELCSELDLIFIGPEADAMRRLGDKIAAKRLAESVHIPVIPWSNGFVSSLDEATAHAERIGFPLMVKAAGGGGGRGIRRIDRPAELRNALESARSEALKAFGNPTLYLERLIPEARHVEVQIIADHHGAVWPLGVRDCSVQRRNQKLIEEAPSPALSAELDSELRTAAVRLARAAGYSNAGTAEFLFCSQPSSFYFLEFNTRLQVEHPVTEATTGVDLIKLQLLVAAGGRLEGMPPKTRGHAIEVRLNAEDPDNDFAPAPGIVEHLRLPSGPGIRVDSGIGQGDAIPPEFDSMIAKIIAYGRDRTEAIARLRRALQETAVLIRGGTTNKSFLQEILKHPDILSGKVHVQWLAHTLAERTPPASSMAGLALFYAAIQSYRLHWEATKTELLFSASQGSAQIKDGCGESIHLHYQGHAYECDVRYLGHSRYHVAMDGRGVDLHLYELNPFEQVILFADQHYRILSTKRNAEYLVEIDGVSHKIARDDQGILRAPAPAIVLSVLVKPGDSIAKGDVLAVLEAMKVEISVVAPSAGRVRQVLVSPTNMYVAGGDPLFIIDAPAHTDSASIAKNDKSDLFLGPLRGLIAEGEEKTPSRRTCSKILEDLRSFMLGYDFDPDHTRSLIQAYSSSRSAIPSEDSEITRLENQLLRLFIDLGTIKSRLHISGHLEDPTFEVLFQRYLRSIDARGEGFPEPFLACLQRVLEHYGVTSLDPSIELREALFCLHRANQRLAQGAEVVTKILNFWSDHLDVVVSSQDHQRVIDRLADELSDKTSFVSTLAKQLRFRYIELPIIEESRRRRTKDVMDRIKNLVRSPRQEIIQGLVESPHSLFKQLAPCFHSNDPRVRRAAYEIYIRRSYAGRDLRGYHTLEGPTGLQTFFEYVSYRDRKIQVMATCAPYKDVNQAMLDSRSFAEGDGWALSDILLIGDNSLRTRSEIGWPKIGAETPIYQALPAHFFENDTAYETLVRCLEQNPPRSSHHMRLVVSIMRGDEAQLLHYTFYNSQGRWQEEPIYRGIHHIQAERLCMWRLRNFNVKRYSAPEDFFVFHGIAKDNAKDERFFVIIDVRELYFIRDEIGSVVRLPRLDDMFTEAAATLRDLQYRRGGPRTDWNRIILQLPQPLRLGDHEFDQLTSRLAAQTRDIGIEKVVFQSPSEAGEKEHQTVHINIHDGTVMRIRRDSLSTYPIRTLTPYAQKVARLRRRGMIYPYEIIRLITPQAENNSAFPPGEFQEHDLDENQHLVPVDRPLGGNTANVVVGVIRNSTTKYPEGMTRVMILGDPSSDMGALAEPECRRILCALDLAESLSVPVEWFPVSSGAKISMASGTENLDWTARVLRRIIEFTQGGGEINLVVLNVNVGAQSYWNAEATMLMHNRGILIMTPNASMVLTGKRALDYSGSVSGIDNIAIGGINTIAGPNGQAQIAARDLVHACELLFQYYEQSYVFPGEHFSRRATTQDPIDRDITLSSYVSDGEPEFTSIGDVFSSRVNPDRKKSFCIRPVMEAVLDQDRLPLERWSMLRGGETTIVLEGHLGGIPVCLIGFESRPLPRVDFLPADGPSSWTGGTLFPLSSKKVARAINSASGHRPALILANLVGFDGSPESLRNLQLEYGAEIGRAVVNFKGPMIFCVLSRYHGGAYVVFSRTLNDDLEVVALEGSYASVIGGAPAAAVIFPVEANARALADPRILELKEKLAAASLEEKPALGAQYHTLFNTLLAEKQKEIASEFERIHSVARAQQVGSIHHIIEPGRLRLFLYETLTSKIVRWLAGQ